MTDSDLAFESKNHLLGEILTSISSPKRYSSSIVLSEAVILEREPANLRDQWAIQVKNTQGNSLGYLSRLVTKWLAPLLDTEKVRTEGFIPARPGVSRSLKPFSVPIVLSVFIAEQEDGLLNKKNISTREDIVHQIVFQAYQQANRFTDPKLIEHLAEGLKPLARQKLHPETHLLLALLPGIANENRVAQALKRMVQSNDIPGRNMASE
ncbi:MAG: HIRAN domain-containing protein [Thermoguttaceae bacterium]|jgi:hypothetical protein